MREEMKIDISTLKRTNFLAEDFIASRTAKLLNIDNNIYCPIIFANLSRTADKAQEIRDFLENPVYGSNFYRCLELNIAVKGSEGSRHKKGQAGDITSPKFGSPREIFYSLKDSGIVFDQVLMEGSWIHYSIRATGMNRREFALYELDASGKRVKIII